MLPYIIDVEASGFGAGSYPIEIGIVMPDRETHCFLVKPEPDWVHWDAQAAGVHGIDRQELVRLGKPVAEIAQCLNELLGREVIYTDAWGVDSSWIAKLYDAADAVPSFRLETLRKIISEPQVALWTATKNTVIRELDLKRHRASADATILQQTFERSQAMLNK
ncbi:MAG: hypothetical protein COB04_12495 [Gammaproteobacteria bacterium]|nr:MAG: hypothetical protein COB04_12495 [Gammaproteobacteria bacterium]